MKQLFITSALALVAAMANAETYIGNGAINMQVSATRLERQNIRITVSAPETARGQWRFTLDTLGGSRNHELTAVSYQQSGNLLAVAFPNPDPGHANGLVVFVGRVLQTTTGLYKFSGDVALAEATADLSSAQALSAALSSRDHAQLQYFGTFWVSSPSNR